MAAAEAVIANPAAERVHDRFAPIGPEEGAWRDLEARARLPAPGASMAWAMPIARHLGLTVFTPRGDSATAVFPVKRRRFPVPGHESWRTPLSFHGAPLLAGGAEAETFQAFVDRPGGGPILLRTVPADGPFWDMLMRLAQAGSIRCAPIQRWRRAALAGGPSFPAWYEANFDRKRRKEFRRLRARLGEAGDLRSLTLDAGASLDGWIDELLALEASGWKGRRGTALQSDPRLGLALREALLALAADGSLRFWKLALDGQPLAMLFATVRRGHVWLGKIAYDETFAKYSPGVLLILDATESLLAEPGFVVADSCAIPGHPMIDRIWRDRVAMADVLVAPARWPKLAFDLLVGFERGRLALRGWLRDTFNRIAGRHRS